jgi:hypothetical protein
MMNGFIFSIIDFLDRNMPKTAVQMIVFPIDDDYFRKESDFAPNSVGSLR